ncbi:TPA: hypothetical protein DIU27_04330 [Candidatus Collierbacteria bacterium]|uniref:Uncharacterized protein n=1 Tax=Candidatus Collierbacteria bacterium GW2011_GWB2_44_22 TaxID=1618387 RepID=A0A0G1KUY1_9BACT|nr:MAG: hypothetical protein UW31_C0013G0018 [Candidatus Collierbacteria bacterium GW2011_GWA2_44_13]KKT49116.1 MAG: hypothetical protein UW42_C0040G0005 [Candidatus Collierbacteria bacterium GW2011_GWB1_44_197]KKT51699.1 MAG: hypothetical protein UW44_C0008G0021 [Candidatus Collierbacteria bacterium GW2011_GWB2_44_22]KKT62496.1 MAG: hypothetical protein UW56_C0006G0019 [Candidatus Collierbacteria bacterium GW2011_GWD1_44_27]KKT66918.1 MAG: hypothetical protein UW58_C0001G0022 [Candidatus Colli
MSDALLLEMEKEIREWKVGTSKTWPYNLPGVDAELVDLMQEFLDRTLGKGKFKVSMADFALSLKIERIS